MTLIPYGDEYCSNLPNILKICLKLAKINAYNDNFIMLGKNKLNIIEYISSLFQKDQKLNHFDEFIDLLNKANIDSDLIINDVIKSKLTPKLYTTVSPIKIKSKIGYNGSGKRIKWDIL